LLRSFFSFSLESQVSSYHSSIVKVQILNTFKHTKLPMLLPSTSARQTDQAFTLVSDAVASFKVVNDLLF